MKAGRCDDEREADESRGWNLDEVGGSRAGQAKSTGKGWIKRVVMRGEKD